MVTARRPPAPSTAEIQAAAREWALRVDWRAVRVVVWAGSYRHEPWAGIRSVAENAIVVVWDRSATSHEVEPGVFVAAKPHDLAAAVERHYHTRDRVELAGDPGAESELQAARVVVDRAVEYAAAMETTIRLHARTWVELGLDVLPRCVGRAAVQTIPATWAGRPGIVVGAGPSLDDDLDALAALTDRALVIAASTAAGPLARRKIAPHAWVCAEQRPESYDDLERLGSHRGTVLIPGIHANPGFWDLEADDVVPLASPTSGIGTALCQVYRLPVLATGGSVTTLAYAALRQLGASPIILVGQDCAIPERGRTHAVGRSGERSVARCAQITGWRQAGLLSTAPAWGGLGTVTTTPALRIFARYYEQQAAAGHALIQTSRRGARLHGVAEAPLESLRYDVPAEAPGDALRAAIAAAPRMDREPMLARLRAERSAAERYAARARVAARAAADLVAAQDAYHTVGHEAVLASCYSTPPADEVREMLPRLGVLHLAATAERCAASTDLIPLIDRAIGAVERVR